MLFRAKYKCQYFCHQSTTILGEKINDNSLRLLTESNLVAMGITQAGPRILILNHIEEIQAHVEHNVVPAPGSMELTREAPEADADFRLKYLYRTLDCNLVPDEPGLHAITRIATKPLADRIKGGGK